AHLNKQTIEKNQFNRKKTEKTLGISILNLYYKIDKYQLAKDSMQ
ncbi:helix-turn-helix domain-containing protein, partial [Bacillus altitudinis]